MKMASKTFFCDATQCPERVTVVEERDLEAYIDLVTEKGWTVVRLFGGWKHYCPAHDTKEKREAAEAEQKAVRKAAR